MIGVKEKIVEVVDKNLFDCDESGGETCKYCACREGCINNISSHLYTIFQTEINNLIKNAPYYFDDDLGLAITRNDLEEYLKGIFDE